MSRRWIAPIFVAAVLAWPGAAAAQRGSPRMELAGRSIDGMVADFMAAEDVPGVALAIVQAPYIPRVTGYGVADIGKKLLVGSNTLFDVGEMANTYVGVAVMQLVEDGKLALADPIGKYLADLPSGWNAVAVRDLLMHASGLPDFEQEPGYDPAHDYQPTALIALVGGKPLAFAPGSAVAHSATDYVLLARIVEAASGRRLRDFVRERQFEALDLRHTVFSDETARVKSEAVELNDNRHKHFLAQAVFINPTERATGYRDGAGGLAAAPEATPSGKFGYGAILASAMDISIWDIGLAGGVLVKDPSLRAILYNPATLADGRTVPVMGDWRFPGRKGLMYVTGSDNGHSAFLSRFTDASELVCVTLLANREGVDLTRLGRMIAGAYDPRLAPPDVPGMRMQQSPYEVAETIGRFKAAVDEAARGSVGVEPPAPTDKGAGVALRIAAAGKTIPGKVWEQDGQVWVGYADPGGAARSLRDALDRALLRAVTPY